jgi:thiopeptide-type bacteriocin biosynthesis protein
MIRLVEEEDNRDLAGASDKRPTVQSWLEARCEFPLRMKLAGPIIPWSQLGSMIRAGQQGGHYTLAFFVRKPPGLRLRFQVKHDPAELRRIVAEWFEPLERAGAVIRHVLTVYEPEESRFGGPEGMAVAHQLWSRDTEVVLRYESLHPARRSTVSRTALWAALEQHLLTLTLDDEAEAWDVWCRLARACSALSFSATTVECYKRMLPRLIEPRFGLLALLTPELRLIFTTLEQANVESATALKRLSDDGKLTRGLRSWLTANALFHANRWALGLEAEHFRAVIEAMVNCLEPDRYRRRDS